MQPVSDGNRTWGVVLFSAIVLLTAGLVVYSQTSAFTWDEGFHILTAQLIKHGKRPYLDFVFSQTPLNAYWNAGWMALFGESWRVPHVFAALCSAATVILAAGFVRSRFPEPRWRLPGAVMASLLIGLNVLVVRYGGIAQPYGLCLVAVVAAFRLAVRSVERHNVVSAGLAGVASGIAVASSLLTAPIPPILLIWILAYSPTRRRWLKLASFVLGNACAFVPLLWLFAQGPQQVFFGIIQYNALYRRVDWPDAVAHNLEVFASWIDSGQALLLMLLAAGGLLFVAFRSDWHAQRKAELYLCAWLSLALTAYISSVFPTFGQYYIFTVPFLGVLAAVGLYAAASSLHAMEHAWPPVLILTLLFSLGLAKSLYEEHDNMVWAHLERIARKVSEVTTPHQTLLADESIYFLTRHDPPSGMEMANSHKFDFPHAQLALLHLIPQAELDRQIKSGAFSTLETCEEKPYVKAQGWANLYARSATVSECTIFWDRRLTAPALRGSR
jgi:4-amino-4-deoxy-L-arabinose transferase-like glycosyltransferase